jgi:hypothetical protein
MPEDDPDDERDLPIVNGQYDDEDESFLPLFDEGYFDSWGDDE